MEVRTLLNVGWTVQHQRGVEGEVLATNLVFIDQQTGSQTVIPLDPRVAGDIGGQLQGEAPRKHVEVVGAGALAQLHKNGNGSPPAEG
jgi:hypothetical protein